MGRDEGLDRRLAAIPLGFFWQDRGRIRYRGVRAGGGRPQDVAAAFPAGTGGVAPAAAGAALGFAVMLAAAIRGPTEEGDI